VFILQNSEWGGGERVGRWDHTEIVYTHMDLNMVAKEMY
jgi:hypothetical protein